MRGIVILGIAAIGLSLGHIHLRNTSALYNLFLSPADLYEPLASIEFAEEPSNYSFHVTHRYPGQYQILVAAPTSPGIGVEYETDFQTRITVKYDSNELLDVTQTKPEFNFWKNDGGGISLISYRVPEQVPKDKQVTLVLEVEGNPKMFVENYGKSTIQISKMSDE